MSNNNIAWPEEDNIVPEKHGRTVREIVSGYLSYLPLFLISLLACVALGFIYLYYTTPKYNISESILIKNRLSSPSTSNMASNDLLSIALDGGSTMNIDNETQLLHSISLMERIVAKNQLNISYYKCNAFKKTDLYPDAPFRLTHKDSGTGTEAINFKINEHTRDNVNITASAEDSDKVTMNVKWNQPFEIYGSHFVLAPGNSMDDQSKYLIIWKPVSKMADDIGEDLSVSIPDKKTTIIKLSLLAENIQKGQDILNWVVKEYNQSNIEDKSTLAQNTIQFIDDRLKIVTNELSGVEGNLEGFQGSSRLVDVQAQASQQLENTNDISKNISDIRIQQGVVDILQNYFTNPASKDKLVPSSLGINDATLVALISKYNELQSKRQREAPQLAANSIVLQDIDGQINDVKTSIGENLQNIRKNLQLQEAGRRQKDQEYQGFISELPRKQRMLQDIKRKQTVTEGLYLYLLQKREETAISFSTANAATFKQIDPPKADEKPAEPNRMLVKIGSVLLGLLIPFGWIRMREALDDKIAHKNDIVNATAVPVIGEVSHIAKGAANGMSVLQSVAAGEQFRHLRTDIALLPNQHNQVILVTSAGNNEGKSLVSSNLAAVLAMPGKKVALLQFDLRNGDAVTGAKGLTDFLNGNVNDITGLYQKTTQIPTLHKFSTGTISENPGDLLLGNKLETLFAALKKEYDFIVIDTAAAGLVSDTFILGKYSDISLFVVRLGHTSKKQIDTLNDIAAKGKLNNVGVVVNDL